LSCAYLAKELTCFDIFAIDKLSAFLRTGTKSPDFVATAKDIST